MTEGKYGFADLKKIYKRADALRGFIDDRFLHENLTIDELIYSILVLQAEISVDDDYVKQISHAYHMGRAVEEYMISKKIGGEQ
jgi:hypothetical protein